MKPEVNHWQVLYVKGNKVVFKIKKKSSQIKLGIHAYTIAQTLVKKIRQDKQE